MVSGGGSDADHGDFLEIGAVVAGGLQAIEPELGGDVFGGDVAATLSGAAAFEEVEREEADVGADVLGIDFLEGGDGVGREMGGFDGRGLGLAGGVGGEGEDESKDWSKD